MAKKRHKEDTEFMVAATDNPGVPAPECCSRGSLLPAIRVADAIRRIAAIR